MRTLTSAHWEARLEAPTGSGSEIWQYTGDSDMANKAAAFTFTLARSSEEGKTPLPAGPLWHLLLSDSILYGENGKGGYMKVVGAETGFILWALAPILNPQTGEINVAGDALPTQLLPGTPEVETLGGVPTLHFVADQTALSGAGLLPASEGQMARVEFWVAPGDRPLLYQLRSVEVAGDKTITILWRWSQFNAPVPFQTPAPAQIQES
jgi:hypothetical protein